MFKVGVTGGIGSGKSTVCNVFRLLDIPVYEADVEARRIMAEDTGLKQDLLNYFGEKAFIDNVLNRKYLAVRIFSDKDARKFINTKVHPLVRKDFLQWTEKQETPYVVEEAALLFESGAWKEMDFNILVLAEKETRVSRIIKRDKMEPAEALARIASQVDPEEVAKLADHIIYNNDTKFVIPQVLEVDKLLRGQLSNKSD